MRPKFIYTIPTIQNPTSTVMPVERRREILDVSREYGVPVIEDECYADLLWDETWPNSMCAMPGSEHVIHVGSFSKYLSPALRLGYVVAPWAVLGQMLGLKNDGGTSALAQMVVADFMREHYDDHVAALNDRLKRKRDVLIEALEEQFGAAAEFDVPPGGIYLWIKLPDAVDTMKLAAPGGGRRRRLQPRPAMVGRPGHGNPPSPPLLRLPVRRGDPRRRRETGRSVPPRIRRPHPQRQRRAGSVAFRRADHIRRHSGRRNAPIRNPFASADSGFPLRGNDRKRSCIYAKLWP